MTTSTTSRGAGSCAGAVGPGAAAEQAVSPRRAAFNRRNIHVARALLHRGRPMPAACQPRVTRPSVLLKATVLWAGCARGGAHPSDAALADDPGVPDAALDAHFVAPDAAAAADAGCAISAGMTLVLDGNSDLAKYPSAQHVALGAMLGTDDAALAWDREQLYITVTSPAFAGGYEP